MSGILAGLETQVASGKAEVERLSAMVQEARRADNEKATKTRPYFDKQQELEVMIRFRNALQMKIAGELTDLTLPKKRAIPAQRPVRPNKPLNIALGVLAGAILGLLAGGLTLLLPRPTAC